MATKRVVDSIATPALNTATRAVADLKPYARNARTHSPEQVSQIVASILEFGFTMPILIAPDGMVIAGHARLRAAMEMQLAKVPVVVADGWTDAQIRAYVIADNQLALNAAWDKDLLMQEIDALTEMDFDINLLGFHDGDIRLSTDLGDEAEPGSIEQHPADKKYLTCPKCGFEWAI